MAEVVLYDGDAASGLATMLGTLLAQNIEQHPGKLDDLRAMECNIVIEVTDLGESVTLSFAGDRCTVQNGVVGRARLRISTDSSTLMQLGTVRIGSLGLPNYVDANGRAVLRAMATGRLRVRGMRHLGTLNRMTRLFSVM